LAFEVEGSFMDTDDTLKALQQQLADLTANLSEAAKVLEPLNNAEMELKSQEFQIKRAFQEQMDAINIKKKQLAEQKYKAQSLFNQTQQQAKAIEHQITQAKEEAAKKKAEEEKAAKEAEKYKALGERFDQATMAAPWREWAKDHQIAAGHKITQDRYVILADPMGLGKTLSSIITADMAEKVTKEASPEFPFLGIEEQVYVPAKTVWTQKAADALQANEWPFNLDQFSQFVTKKPLIETDNTEHVATPFDPPTINFQYTYRGKVIEAGEETVGYLGYDLKNKLTAEGMIEKTDPYYDTQVTNAIIHPVGRKVLYFCPSPLLRNVLEEWRRWAPHRNVTYIGNMSKAEREYALSFLPKLQDYVIIINYEAWRRDKALLDKLVECEFDTIIVDEAHNIKDKKTSAYKGVLQVIQGCNPEYIIPMTGTPILNRPQELHSILSLLNLKDFPPTSQGERDFLWRYCEEYYPDGNTTNPKYKFKPGGLDLLAKKISTNFMRRTKEQAGIVLPEKTIIYHELDRDDETYPKQAKAREQMKKYATIVLDEAEGKAIQATVIIAMITRLRQIETWPAGIKQIDKTTKEVKFELEVYESQKIDYIIRFDEDSDEWEGLIPDTIEDERIVVFSQFKEPLQELKRRIEKMGYKAAVFDGSTPQDLRDEIRHDFDRNHTPERSKAKYDVLLANYKAAGVGLNLTGATQLITLDEEWNPGKRDQAWDRIHRIGQTQNVTINVVRTKNTIDTWLADIIDEKSQVVSGFEGAMIKAGDLKEALDSGLI
jgi:SNF2 family DNA or RNA helicase